MADIKEALLQNCVLNGNFTPFPTLDTAAPLSLLSVWPGCTVPRIWNGRRQCGSSRKGNFIYRTPLNFVPPQSTLSHGDLAIIAGNVNNYLARVKLEYGQDVYVYEVNYYFV